MTIKCIKIHNTRGISELIISANILKNRPNILVAPNGFGKTSIATAFKNASGQTSIKTDDEDRHQHQQANKSKLEIEVEIAGSTTSYNANEIAHSNDIRKNFDIFVISDLRKVKATSQNFGKFSRPNGKLVIDPIVICPKQARTDNPVKIREVRLAFGNHSSLIENIETGILANQRFLKRCLEILPLMDSLIMARKWNQIETIRCKINQFVGAPENALIAVHNDIERLTNELNEFRSAIELLAEFGLDNIDLAYISLWHIIFIGRTNRKGFEEFLKWRRYSHFKELLQESIKGLNTSWKEVQLKESKGNLIAIFPEPTHVSNGQRDVLTLTCMLYAARIGITKNKAFLIIDEVFDYLDDANLTVAQYYVSQLIQDSKNQKRSLYPIILTHLNPSFFRNYVFSDQNVIYLDKSTQFDSVEALKKLIGARDDKSISDDVKEKISKYLVHYHIDQYDIQSELQSISGVRSSWGKFGKFQQFLTEEFTKYSNGESYDPLAICAITRRSIEEKAYSQISSHPDAIEYFTKHKTAPKLNFAAERGANTPEPHYLLRIIYDEGMHWNDQRDNTIPIVAKLSNPVIKRMIIDAVKD